MMSACRKLFFQLAVLSAILPTSGQRGCAPMEGVGLQLLPISWSISMLGSLILIAGPYASASWSNSRASFIFCCVYARTASLDCLVHRGGPEIASQTRASIIQDVSFDEERWVFESVLPNEIRAPIERNRGSIR